MNVLLMLIACLTQCGDCYWRTIVSHYPAFDWETDGDVDHVDFAHLQRCFGEYRKDSRGWNECLIGDVDADNDVDLWDYEVFLIRRRGPTADRREFWRW